MRTISIIAFTGFLLLWGAYFILKDTRQTTAESEIADEAIEQDLEQKGSVLTSKRKRDLDKIGAVINEKTVRIDEATKEKIKVAKAGYDNKEGVKELQAMLEQSYLDRNSSIKDIKRLQAEISDKKMKLKENLTNSEKWDPRFVYYLMIQENYTYPEINMIKSLAENGLNMEEIEYINELIREESFTERISIFKTQNESGGRVVASAKKPKELDDFITDVNDDGSTIEDKLIEMNYNESEKEEMNYGNNQ